MKFCGNLNSTEFVENILSFGILQHSGKQFPTDSTQNMIPL